MINQEVDPHGLLTKQVNGLSKDTYYKKQEKQYIYILSDYDSLVDFSGENSIIKIGISKTPYKRYSNVRTGSGRKSLIPFMYFQIVSEFNGTLEKSILDYYTDNKIIGEWFNLNPFIACTEIMQNFNKEISTICFTNNFKNLVSQLPSYNTIFKPYLDRLNISQIS